MKRSNHRRRGFVSLFAVMLLGVMAGLMSVIAMRSVQLYRTRQSDRAAAYARSIADSATAYARTHLRERPATQPAEQIALDVAGMLPTKIDGTATLTFPQIEGRTVCRVHAEAIVGSVAAERTVDVKLP